MDSYLRVRAHAEVEAQELLQAVAERMDIPQGELVLVAVTYPGGKYKTAAGQPPAVNFSLWCQSEHKVRTGICGLLVSEKVTCPKL